MKGTAPRGGEINRQFTNKRLIDRQEVNHPAAALCQVIHHQLHINLSVTETVCRTKKCFNIYNLDVNSHVAKIDLLYFKTVQLE